LPPHVWPERPRSGLEIRLARKDAVVLARSDVDRVDLVQALEQEVPADRQPQCQQEEDAARPLLLSGGDDEGADGSAQTGIEEREKNVAVHGRSAGGVR